MPGGSPDLAAGPKFQPELQLSLGDTGPEAAPMQRPRDLPEPGANEHQLQEAYKQALLPWR